MGFFSFCIIGSEVERFVVVLFFVICDLSRI